MFTLIYLLLAGAQHHFIHILAMSLGLPAMSPSHSLSHANASHLNVSSIFAQDNTRLDDVLSRRNFVWTDTIHDAQNLCGDSTFTAIDADADGDGPGFDDCVQFVTYARQRDGYWLVTGFGERGWSWREFSTLSSCKIGVRRTDGGSGTVPIGNQDVIDLLNSVMNMYGGGDTLPTTQGNMSCCQDSTIAAVEWQIYNDWRSTLR